MNTIIGDRSQPAHGRHHVAHRAHDRFCDLCDKLNGRVAAARCDPAHNHYSDHRPEVDFDDQIQNVQNGPNHQCERVEPRNAAAEGNKNKKEG